MRNAMQVGSYVLLNHSEFKDVVKVQVVDVVIEGNMARASTVVAEKDPYSEPRRVLFGSDQLVKDKLICHHCGRTDDETGFKYLEDIQNERIVQGFDKRGSGYLIIDSFYTVDNRDDGTN